MEDIRFLITIVVISVMITLLIYIVFFEETEDDQVISTKKISHRIAFEHRYFKLLLFDDPYYLFQRLLDYETSAVVSTWNNIGANLSQELMCVEELNSKDITLLIHPHHDGYIALIKMPKPLCISECYYIGLIFPRLNTIENVRYIMLLKEEDEQGRACTVLGEWSKKGHYINLARDIVPRTDAFLQALVTSDQ